MSNFTPSWPTNRDVLYMVCKAELEWGTHEKAVSRVARQLGWEVSAVIEACDLVINPEEEA